MNLYLTLATRYGLNILGLLGVSAALYLGSSILIPLVISGLLAAMLYPGALWVATNVRIPWFNYDSDSKPQFVYHGIKVPWILACMAVILTLVIVTFVIVFAVSASVPQMINRLPDTDEKWERKYEEFARRLGESLPFSVESALPTKAANSQFYKSVKNLFAPEQLAGYLKALGGGALFYISHTVLVLFITLFLMLEGQMLMNKVRAIFGSSRENERRVKEAVTQMATAIRTYLLWRSLINLLLGLTVALAYKVLGLEQWYLWGVLTFVLNYVPYIGTIAAGIPPVLEALFGGNAEVAMVIIVAYTILVTFEGYWIVPRVMGKTMDLNATTVMITCLYWNLVWGIAGLFLAMPLMAAVKSVLMNVEGWQPWGELLSSEEVPHEALPATEPTAVVDDIRLLPGANGEANVTPQDAEIRH